MKIREIHIIEFGGLKDRTITLGEGLNILEGENESGKSTLLLFIKFMLYGLPRKNHEDRARSVSRGGHRAAGTMTLTHEGVEYRIERVFTEGARTGSEQMRILRTADGEEVFVGQNAGEVLLKVPREVFESSCGIGQMKCDQLGGKKGSDAIRNLLSSADETTDIVKIEDRLDKLRVTYRHKSGKGGRLPALSEQIHNEKLRLDRALEAEQRKILLRQKLERAEKQAAENTQKTEELSRLLSELGKLELLRRFEKLRENERTYDTQIAQMRDLRTVSLKTDYMPSRADAPHLSMLADNLESAQNRLAAARARLGTVEYDTAYDSDAAADGERIEAEGGAALLLRRFERSRKIKKFCTVLAVLSLLFAVACAGIGLWRSITPLLAVAALGVLSAIGFFLGGRAGGSRIDVLLKSFGIRADAFADYLTRATDALRDQREAARQIAATEAAVNAEQAMVDGCLAKLASALSRTLPSSETSVSAARAEAVRIEQFLRSYYELEARSRALLQTMQNERELLSGYREDDLRAELSLNPDALWSVDVKRAKTERDFYTERGRVLAGTIRQAQIELISTEASTDVPIELADRLSRLQDEYRRAEDYFESLELAIEGLRNAAQTMSGSVTPALGRDAGSMLEYISDGKYNVMRTGGELTPSLLSAEGLTTTPELFSGGTRDAAYLTLRLALMMQIFVGELPPLLMDESLCQIDDGRMRRVLALLGKLTESRFQCLLFTCHTRESAACAEMDIPHRKIVL